MDNTITWRDFVDEQAYVPPLTWTPEHVLHRMVEACGAMARTLGGAGPKGYGSGWPSYVHTTGDINSQISNMVMTDGTTETDTARDGRLRRDAEIESRRLVIRPSKQEIDLMDEALAWPALYLHADYDITTRRREVLIVSWAHRVARGKQGSEPISQVFDEAAVIAKGLARANVLVR